MLSDRTTFPGQHCELGGELIDTGHETMHRLAKELGIAFWLDSVGAKGAMRTLLEVAYTIEFGLEPAHCNRRR